MAEKDTQSKVVLILGAGPNIGESIASKFSNNGYQVAIAARSLSTGVDKRLLNIQADFSDPAVVPSVFEAVKNEFGIPNVVVYNVAARLTTPPEDPFSASLEALKASRRAGLDSAYVAAQEALKGFKSLPSDTPTAFIFTGNTLNQIAIPGVMPFALGKVAAAMMIEYAANAYGTDGYRFYFADERQPDGRPAALDRDGTAHAEMYWELAHEAKQSKWLVTFTKAGGRQDFVGVDFGGETRAMYDQKFGRSLKNSRSY